MNTTSKEQLDNASRHRETAKNAHSEIERDYYLGIAKECERLAETLAKQEAEDSETISIKKIPIDKFINALAEACHETSVSKGWWEERDALIMSGGFARSQVEATLLMLTISELAEGMEGLRKDLQDDHLPEFKMIECELADAMIRILDHAAAFNYRLGEAFVAKMEYNSKRSHKHGGKAF